MYVVGFLIKLLLLKLSETRILEPEDKEINLKCSFLIVASSKNAQIQRPQNIALLQMTNFNFQKGKCHLVAYNFVNLTNAIGVYQAVHLSKAKIPWIEVHIKDEAVEDNFLIWIKKNIKNRTVIRSPRGKGDQLFLDTCGKILQL